MRSAAGSGLEAAAGVLDPADAGVAAGSAAGADDWVDSATRWVASAGIAGLSCCTGGGATVSSRLRCISTGVRLDDGVLTAGGVLTVASDLAPTDDGCRVAAGRGAAIVEASSPAAGVWTVPIAVEDTSDRVDLRGPAVTDCEFEELPDRPTEESPASAYAQAAQNPAAVAVPMPNVTARAPTRPT